MGPKLGRKVEGVHLAFVQLQLFCQLCGRMKHRGERELHLAAGDEAVTCEGDDNLKLDALVNSKFQHDEISAKENRG